MIISLGGGGGGGGADIIISKTCATFLFPPFQAFVDRVQPSSMVLVKKKLKNGVGIVIFKHLCVGTALNLQAVICRNSSQSSSFCV